MKNGNFCPNQQAAYFENVMENEIEFYFPTKKVKFSISDKPFITQELKILKRKRQREYVKNGKSKKYLILKDQFSKIRK